jgi:hypothetical protein
MQVEPSLRASDADREQVAQRLRHATAEGRLSGDELEERLDTVHPARTVGELEVLLADLPAIRTVGHPRVRLRGLVGAVSAVTLMLAALGVLAITRGRYAEAVLGARHPRHLSLPSPLAGPHYGLIAVASLGVVFVVLLTGATLLWALMRSRSPQHL